MSIRLFVCDSCGHKLRLGAESCGYCRQPTPLFNRAGILAITTAAVLLLIYTGIILALA